MRMTIGSIQYEYLAGGAKRPYFCALYTPPHFESFAEWFKGPEVLGKTKVNKEGVSIDPTSRDRAKISGPLVEALFSELSIELHYKVDNALGLYAEDV